jgi:hypothetical protein
VSVNKYLPHIFVLPEDDANRDLANGFLLDDSLAIRRRRIQVLEEVGGWTQVLERFKSDHVIEMDRNPHRFMVLLIDFDDREDRLGIAKAAIPERLTDRVFVLGALSEPEDLKKANLGSYETIGKTLANECRKDVYETWDHDLLRHNANELARLREHVRPILFESA